MRRRMGDWLAEYGDGPEHERYEYTLAFARPTEVSLFGPRNFSVQADGAKATEHTTRALVKGNVIRIRDEERPLGVVDVSGDIVEEKLIVRCASSGLPLAFLDPEKPRLEPCAVAQQLRGRCVAGQSAGSWRGVVLGSSHR